MNRVLLSAIRTTSCWLFKSTKKNLKVLKVITLQKLNLTVF